MSRQSDGLAIAFQAIALARDENRTPTDIALLHDALGRADIEAINYTITGLASMVVSLIELHEDDPETYLNTLGPVVFEHYPDQ